MKKQKNRNGFTLIELLVTMAASAILVLTVALILIMALRSWRINNAFVDLRSDSAFAFSMMTRDVREADDGTLTDGNPLILPGTFPGKPMITYTWNGVAGTLEYNNETDTMLIIHEGVQFFDSQKVGTGDGVLLTLELANTELGIALTNQVFVNTRN